MSVPHHIMSDTEHSPTLKEMETVKFNSLKNRQNLDNDTRGKLAQVS